MCWFQGLFCKCVQLEDEQIKLSIFDFFFFFFYFKTISFMWIYLAAHELLKYPFLVPQVSEDFSVRYGFALSCMQICVLLSFWKGLSPAGLRPTLMTSFNVSHLFKWPLSTYRYIQRYLRLGLQPVNLAEHSSFHNTFSVRWHVLRCRHLFLFERTICFWSYITESSLFSHHILPPLPKKKMCVCVLFFFLIPWVFFKGVQYSYLCQVIFFFFK